MYTLADQQRYVEERPLIQSRLLKDRGEFNRDRARIIHSSAFRRLAGKTQVLTSGHDDFVRTRLTHSLEVAQIGRQMAEFLGTNTDLVETACLAHDIGHPPFGHLGEKILNEMALDIGGFEGNAQTFRILTKLEPKILKNPQSSVGLNLTRGTLDAIIKYPWSESEKLDHAVDAQNPKYNYYADDTEIYDWVREPAQGSHRKCLEAQIMDFADDISYCVNDFEDGYAEGLINYEHFNLANPTDELLDRIFKAYNHDFTPVEFEHAFERLHYAQFFNLHFDGSFKALATLKSITSALIGRFVTSVCYSTVAQAPDIEMIRYNTDLSVERGTEAEIMVIKSLVYALIYESEMVLKTRDIQGQIVRDLVDYFMSKSPKPAKKMADWFLFFWNQAETEDQRFRVAIDQVASLTDTSAVRLQFSKN
ncbi:MAG: deoxyguanosinetriphosphate triphosphohydrolase [Bifidobacteriaceae bacterium]|jgi:dGTPase|nr:deoxyguanosinetriphosphate triphosphohydrolase [Bifidobacteriaceae bacterium]